MLCAHSWKNTRHPYVYPNGAVSDSSKYVCRRCDAVTRSSMGYVPDTMGFLLPVYTLYGAGAVVIMALKLSGAL